MKQFLWFSMILICLTALPSQAQIVIEPDDIQSDPGTLLLYYAIYHEDGLQINLGEAGADQHWDFTDYMFPRIDDDEVLDPDDAPHLEDFPDANRVLRSMDSGLGLDIDDGLRYELVADESWILLGIEISEEQDLGIPIDFIELPTPIQILPMPAEFGDEWDWDGEVTFTIAAPDTLAELFDSLDVTLEYDGSAEIDAWGTLNYPSGEAEVLRQHVEVGGVITAGGVRYLWGQRIVIDLGEVYALAATHTYRWFTNDLGELISITSRPGEEEQNFELATKIRSRFLDDLEFYTDFARTPFLHALVFTDVSFNGEPVPAGWEIGVFTPEDLLAGGGVWRGPGKIGIPAWSDHPGTEEVDGFRPEEELLFKIWDPETEEEYAAEAIFEEGPEVWTNDEVTVLSLEAGAGEEQREMTIPLRAGWNMISINVSPGEAYYDENEDRGPDIVLMTEQMRIDDDHHHISILKDELGRFYAPGWDFCNIPYWNLTQGYQVDVDEELAAVWSGLPIPFDAEIPIAAGWNMIAYYPTWELSVTAPDFYAVASIIDQIEIMKDELGRFLSPAWGFSNMPALHEGEGYQVNASEETILQYPVPEEEIVSVRTRLQKNGIPIRPTSENMSVLINSISGLVVAGGEQITACNVSGELVGRGVVDAQGRCGLAVWGDDPTTEETDGALAGAALSLQIWDHEQEITHPLVVTNLLEGQELTYQKDALLVLGTAVQSTVPDHFYLTQNYPNPFNNVTRFNYGLSQEGEVIIQIYDLGGRQVEILVNQHLEAGKYDVSWTADEHAAGIYLVKMSLQDELFVRKVMLLK